MPPRNLLASLALAALFALPVSASEKLVVTVSHDLALARPSETITVPWAEVNRALPHALVQKIAVRDASGRILPYQVTNVAPQAKDPDRVGAAYGELIFQHDFATGEKSAVFTVEQTDAVSPPFPIKAFARAVPERLDDFAWENDRIAHRTYGPSLAAPASPGSGKEVLVTSGLDLWCKRVSYPIVDRWYNKGHDHYHKDEGEGMDMYGVSASRGCGGLGIWDGSRLYVSSNYKTARVLANGPVRAIFELTYDTWDAGGVFVSETKRFTVDAGRNLDQIESIFAAAKVDTLTVAIGLNKNSADKKQEPVVTLTPAAAAGSLAQWIVQKTNGSLGTAIVVVDPAAFSGFAEDSLNQLILAKVAPNQPLRYLAGAGWDRSGQFASQAEWLACVAAESARARSPVTVSLSVAP
ncbi:hypothetical protein IMCC26134_12540 [Verrucomicrobia bacterium IMCC26134]|nr:hypothetical protein IMCC26134_12540 [Verrucomicrobia bacterium IMCC26134]